ncbi:MAG: S9 family peptidase [Fimbriimonas sp.]
MPKRAVVPEDLLRLVFVGDAQMHPDGQSVLFARKHIDAKNKYLTHLWSVTLGGELKQWTQGDVSCGQGRWSPDGSQIAFVSGRDKPSSQLFLISAHGGEARKITSLEEGSIGEFRWSPDGTKIALLYRPTPTDRTEKAKKEREEKGLSTPPWEIDNVWYRLDGDGYFGSARFHLYVLDVLSGALTLVCNKSSLGEYSFDWSPTSTELAVIYSTAKRPSFDPPKDEIFRITLDRQEWKVEGAPTGDKTAVRWSPDGKWLAFAGDDSPNDSWGTHNKKLYVLPSVGGECRCLSSGYDYDLSVATLSDTAEASYGVSLFWSPDSKALFTRIGWHGESQLAHVSLDGVVELLTSGHHHLGVGSASADGSRIATTYGHPTKLAEIGVIEPELGTGKMVAKVLTDLNHDFHAEVELVEPEEFWLDGENYPDGNPCKVHGWVMLPPDYLAPKRIAGTLHIHGGPHTQYGWTYFHEMQVHAAAGYAVVYSNPRGSKGYGEKFCTAIKGDWGRQDWWDIQTVTRWMQSHPAIHPGQIGVCGGSYGGYMTNWAIGHTDAFRAAITDRCVSNFVSMAGNSDFPFNKDGYFKGFFYGGIEDIRSLWDQSPIAYFKDVKTPTLVIHSEGDLRCNVEQSEQVFSALQDLGVESRFVRYPSTTSHGMSRMGPPDLRLHRLGEYLQWWKKYLG